MLLDYYMNTTDSSVSLWSMIMKVTPLYGVIKYGIILWKIRRSYGETDRRSAQREKKPSLSRFQVIKYRHPSCPSASFTNAQGAFIVCLGLAWLWTNTIVDPSVSILAALSNSTLWSRKSKIVPWEVDITHQTFMYKTALEAGVKPIVQIKWFFS